MNSAYLFIVFVCFGYSFAFPGEYVPKAFYLLDEEGHKSNLVYLSQSALPRARRSSTGESYGGGFAFDGGVGGVDDIASEVQAGLGSTFSKLRSLAGEVQARSAAAGAGSGGSSFSGSFSSNGGGGGEGPVLYSRTANGEKELVTGGNGRIHATSSASGPNGGISYSSSSVDSDGRVSYSSVARKF